MITDPLINPELSPNSNINLPQKKPSALLYIPNLIGYLRIALLLLSAHFATAHEEPRPDLFVVFYAMSAGLDAVDGMAARALNQCSNLGSVLDMITDRLTTTSLIMILSRHYPEYTSALIAAVCLDVGSHWMFHYYNAVKGEHHKNVESRPAGNPASKAVAAVIRYYYSTRPFFMYACVCPELFYVGLYALAAFPGMPVRRRAWIVRGVKYVAAPGFVVKQVTNLAQMVEAARGVDEGGVDLIL